MCSIGYHTCPTCGDAYSCSQKDFECNAGYNYKAECNKCEYWIEEERRQMEREEQLKWKRDQWEREHTFDEEG